MSPNQRFPVVLVAVGSAILAFALWFIADSEAESPAAAAGASSPTLSARAAPTVLEPVTDAPPLEREPQRNEAPPAASEAALESPPKVFFAGEVHMAGAVAAGARLRIARLRSARAPSRSHVRALDAATEVDGVTVLRPIAIGAPYSSDAQGVTDAGGNFRIDITRLVLNEPPPALAIEVLCEGSAPMEFEFPVRVDESRWGREAEHELRAILLVPTTCDVVGRVSATWVDPIRVHTRPAASVAAFELLDGRPTVSSMLSANCERSSGEFALHLECGRDYVLVALVDGFRPWSRIYRANGFLDLGELVLERGESIAGRAQLAGSPVHGAVRARLKSASAAENLQCCIGGRWLVWTGAGFEWESQGVVTAEGGRFEISGLAQASYTLELGNVRDAYASSSTLVEVAAPARAVELSSRVCRVDLEVFDEGAPAANRSLEISEVGGSAMTIGTHRTDASGVATLWVDPARTTSIALLPPVGDRAAASKASRRIECDQPGRAVALRVDF